MDSLRNFRILPAGDRAVVAEFGDTVDEKINQQVHALAAQLTAQPADGVLELVPTFRSLLVYYDPAVISYGALCSLLTELAAKSGEHSSAPGRLWEIPCCYGSHFGPDLADVAAHAGLTREEVVFLHSHTDYKIYMLGFLPGFVYLGGLDERLATPRLPSPRVRIPKGSVGIGGSQTGVYPLESPGGWRLIGSTPVDFYDAGREEPVLCRAGDTIRFVPISSSDYYDIRQMIAGGTYKLSGKEPGEKN